MLPVTTWIRPCLSLKHATPHSSAKFYSGYHMHQRISSSCNAATTFVHLLMLSSALLYLRSIRFSAPLTARNPLSNIIQERAEGMQIT